MSALVELCCKRKWLAPEFDIVYDTGPDHKKNFLMQVNTQLIILFLLNVSLALKKLTNNKLEKS